MSIYMECNNNITYIGTYTYIDSFIYYLETVAPKYTSECNEIEKFKYGFFANGVIIESNNSKKLLSNFNDILKDINNYYDHQKTVETFIEIFKESFKTGFNITYLHSE